jgi:hypothetical protein
MFAFCRSLQSIPLLNFRAATTITTIFANCVNLKQAATLAPYQGIWSVNDLVLSPAELNRIFDNLPDLTGLSTKTINITNNWGSVGCNRSIAELKNWSVQG